MCRGSAAARRIRRANFLFDFVTPMARFPLIMGGYQRQPPNARCSSGSALSSGRSSATAPSPRASAAVPSHRLGRIGSQPSQRPFKAMRFGLRGLRIASTGPLGREERVFRQFLLQGYGALDVAAIMGSHERSVGIENGDSFAFANDRKRHRRYSARTHCRQSVRTSAPMVMERWAEVSETRRT